MLKRQLQQLLFRLRGPCTSLAFALALSAGVAVGQDVQVRSDSPQSYTVVTGDTLWDIAGKFLEEPWMWPQVWEMNSQIQNPDQIYPGDVIELTYVDGAPQLRLTRSPVSDLPTVRLSPQVRAEVIRSPVPAIPIERISAHLSPNTVIGAEEYEAAPYLLRASHGHSLIASGDRIFAKGAWAGDSRSYDIIRRGSQFENPDSKLPLGYEAIIVGVATLESIDGESAVLVVDSSRAEIKSGDRFIQRQNLNLEARYFPEPPRFAVDAAIVSIGEGKVIGGLYDSLVLNVGAQDGLRPGHLLSVQMPPVQVVDEQDEVTAGTKFKQAVGMDTGHKLSFPGETVASVLVYRVHAEASQALVLSNSDVIRLSDRVVSP